MHTRSWRWLRTRIFGLLTTPETGWREITHGQNVRTEPIWATRLQAALAPQHEG